MKVLNFVRPENGLTEDPLYYMNFEKYEDVGRNCYLFMADFYRDLYSGIYDRIYKINKLYDKGNYIVYLTARGMGRHSNNVDLAKVRFYEITELQLRLWGCKYHELFLGKPSGDFYIDDKGINSDEFFAY